MDRERLTWERVGRLVLDGVVLTLVWIGLVWLRGALSTVWPLDLVPGPKPVLEPLDLAGHAWLAVLFTPVHLLVLAWQGDYRVPLAPRTGLVALAVSVGLSTALVALGLFALDVEWVSRPVVLGFLVALPIVLSVVRRTRLVLLRWRPARERVVLVGTASEVTPLLERLLAHPEWGMQVVARLGPQADDALWRGTAAELGPVLLATRATEVVVLGRGDPDRLQALASTCDALGVRLALDANFLGMRVGRATVRDLDGFALVSFAELPARGLELAVKRCIDVVGALLGLILLGPLLLVLMALVYRQDGGPALFRQTRAGLHGRPFTVLKLRSMRVGAEQEIAPLRVLNEQSGPVFKLRQDPRVTPLGAFLRRSSLDELPQLVNVLRGEMSLVGPRPPLPDEVARYAPWQRRRLSMRPGLTGLWQVSGRSAVPFDQWMALDLAYIDRWSLGLDVVVMLRTLPAVLSGRGAW